jgi:hypothetical protein
VLTAAERDARRRIADVRHQQGGVDREHVVAAEGRAHRDRTVGVRLISKSGTVEVTASKSKKVPLSGTNVSTSSDGEAPTLAVTRADPDTNV